MVCVVVTMGGCSPKAMRGEAVDLRGRMRSEVKAEVLALGPAMPALGPEVPYVPVVTAPRVQRVWLPAHVDELGDMVAGHWIYLMLERSKWFVEEGSGRPRRGLNLNVPAMIGVRAGQSIRISPADMGGIDGEGALDSGMEGK